MKKNYYELKKLENKEDANNEMKKMGYEIENWKDERDFIIGNYIIDFNDYERIEETEIVAIFEKVILKNVVSIIHNRFSLVELEVYLVNDNWNKEENIYVVEEDESEKVC